VAFAVLAVIAGALLAAAEFTTVYEVVVGELEIVRTKKSGADQHSYALLILAAVTVPLALGGPSGLARSPAHETQRLCKHRRPRRRIRLAGAGQALRALEGLERVAGGRREAPVDLDRGIAGGQMLLQPDHLIAGRALGERGPGFLDTRNVKVRGYHD